MYLVRYKQQGIQIYEWYIINHSEYEESKESTESPKTNEPTSSFNSSKKGQTIYVHGPGLTEEILKKACASFGTIVNISPEFEKQ